MWTRRKFTSLPPPEQHRKAARLLREYYEICAWMEEEPLPDTSHEAISNRYHHHLMQGRRSHKEHNLLPHVVTGDRAAAAPGLPIHLYLDHIRSAHNVGSILRTFEALALGTVFFSPQTPKPDHKQVRATSMGAADWIQWEERPVSGLPGPLIALETAEEAIPYQEFDFPESFTLALGNEEYGLSREVLQSADAVVAIPLFGRKHSLNVANAFAMVASRFPGRELPPGAQGEGWP